MHNPTDNNQQNLSSWLLPDTLEQAATAQREMATQVITQDDFGELTNIAGMDVSNNPYDESQTIYACTVLMDKDCQQVLNVINIKQTARFPYIPGFLGFRETPALVEAFQQLPIKPSLIFVDGHGISHPRGLGIASHIGVLLDCPTIGVAKSLLVGKPAEALAITPGAQVPVIWRGKTIAMLIRSKARCNPLIISTGHKVSLTTAVQLVQNYLRGYRLPEPTRQAHLAANTFRRAQKNS